MADKKFSELTDDEKSEMTAEELAALEEAEADDNEDEGEPDSPRRRSLYDRFKAANDEKKRLERELEDARQEARTRRIVAESRGGNEEEEEEELPQEPVKPEPFDFAAARAKKAAYMKEGEFDKAADVEAAMDEARAKVDKWRDDRDAWKDDIRQREITAVRTEAKQVSAAEAAHAKLQSDIAREAERMYEKYPFLDHREADTKDDDAIAAVNGKFKSLIAEEEAQGKTPDRVALLRKAATVVGDRFKKLRGEDDGKGDKPNGDGRRAEEERKRGAAAAAKEPANTAKGGEKFITRDKEGRAPAADKLTDDQIRNMDPDQIGELYGKKG
jgi:hypothetical protein